MSVVIGPQEGATKDLYRVLVRMFTSTQTKDNKLQTLFNLCALNAQKLICNQEQSDYTYSSYLCNLPHAITIKVRTASLNINKRLAASLIKDHTTRPIL